MLATSQLNVRWFGPEDMNAILEIERRCFGKRCWNKDFFFDYLRHNQRIGLVGEIDNEIVSYILYQCKAANFYLKCLAVKPEFQSMGIGRYLINNLISKLNGNRRSILGHVTDKDLKTHLFLKSVGFRAIRVDRNYFIDKSDAYVFQLKKSTIIHSESEDIKFLQGA